MNIQLYMDDFGTGYSSLSYLHRLPIDTLKIDRSFISTMDIDSENSGIVQAIIMLAHNLGMNVIAEGIEKDQAAKLKNLGWAHPKVGRVHIEYGMNKAMLERK